LSVATYDFLHNDSEMLERNACKVGTHGGLEAPRSGFDFYARDVYVSAVFATATWLGGWVSVCHTPILCLNG